MICKSSSRLINIAPMDINEYYEKLTTLTGDGCKPTLGRIEEALALKEAAKPDDLSRLHESTASHTRFLQLCSTRKMPTTPTT